MSPLEIRQLTLSICAMAFAGLIFWGLIAFGSPQAQRLALLAALCGMISQFVGQSPGTVACYASRGSAYLGMLLVIVAVALF